MENPRSMWPLLVVPLAVGAWWVFSDHHPDRLPHVSRSFAESAGVPYSFGGGHFGNGPVTWPRGGPGIYRGEGVTRGIGWDCIGWVRAVARRADDAPSWADSAYTVSDLWEHLGSPTNGTRGWKPGYLIFWGFPGHPPHHVGYITAEGQAVSAYGPGRSCNANMPGKMVKAHGWNDVGAQVIATVPW